MSRDIQYRSQHVQLLHLQQDLGGIVRFGGLGAAAVDARQEKKHGGKKHFHAEDDL
jgi:hypothetical protein